MKAYTYEVGSCQVDEEDFEYLRRFHWKFDNDGYAFFWKPQHNRKAIRIYMHWVVTTRHGVKILRGMEVDHIDRNRQNNHFNNLRVITHKDNQMNKSKVLLTEDEIERDRITILMRQDGKTEEEINEVIKGGTK